MSLDSNVEQVKKKLASNVETITTNVDELQTTLNSMRNDHDSKLEDSANRLNKLEHDNDIFKGKISSIEALKDEL